MSETLRYEFKYTTGLHDVEIATARVFAACGPFYEEYPERVVHSLYFDTRRFDTYLDHLDGLNSRAKVRVRWYDDGKSYALEIKRRQGLLSRKSVTPLAVKHAQAPEVLPAMLSLGLPDLVPVVCISYTRRYFTTSGGLRATLDASMRIATVDGTPDRVTTPVPQSVICELKFPPTQHAHAGAAAQALGWARIKNSKYVHGVHAAGLA